MSYSLDFAFGTINGSRWPNNIFVKMFQYNEKGLVEQQKEYELDFKAIKPDFTFEEYIKDDVPTVITNTYDSNTIIIQQKSVYESRCWDRYEF